MQWTSRFSEVVIVASCNEHLFPKHRGKKLSDVVIAFRPVIVKHGLDSLQRELSRQVTLVRDT